MKRILVVDDEREVVTFLYYLLSKKGYDVTYAHNYDETIEKLELKEVDLALVDLKMPDTNGITVLKRIKEYYPSCKVVIMTGYSTVKTAVDAIKNGASDYIEKPFDDIDKLEKHIDELIHTNTVFYDYEIEKIAQSIGMVVGQTEEMNILLKMAYKFAKKNINVRIEGETGTGKEVLARFIHEASMRPNQPFIGVNCGAFSETLLESELFGHEKGAFTGASQQRRGLFEVASSGTLFLDEVAEASPSIQVKLLRVLETREFMRVGSEQSLHTNTRIITASHVNLEEAVKKKEFREDLMYRLDVVKLSIPPLRERKEDIEMLVDKLLSNTPSVSFSKESLHYLSNYQWPGNIRELSNVVTRAVALAEGETDVITPEYLPRQITLQKSCVEKQEGRNELDIPQQLVGDSYKEELAEYVDEWKNRILTLWEQERVIDLEEIQNNLKELEEKIERSFVTRALRETLGNRKEASKLLNISVRKLRYIMNEKGQLK
ncbi:sigma-54-dependent transcriptional regulator [Bacillus sp. FJAT-45350]|uniref:sigma-54-dependent transcriptional regulator n=1 Tax=Bacillus sp. FJAT-45350 TaxID=2011014 RepID=UPI000BB96CDA|nr:sigma-54 dependent transcriptional regulator [Bacillus sp. FJAT-45350]